MNFNYSLPIFFAALLVSGCVFDSAVAAQTGTLRIGVAKVDITPVEISGLTNLYQTPLNGVHDRTYARGVVLDNGLTTAALISIDTVEITDATALVARISKEIGIPTSNIIIAATHDHQAPMISLQNLNGTAKAGPAAAAYIAKVEDDLISALKQARASEQPARVGVGRGHSDVNVNRDLLTASGAYTLGQNPDGPSDKTVWVVKFESMTGKPLALLINYAVHGTVLGPKVSLLSGELPGATSRYVEDHYDDNVVAVWTSGAAGDQAPILNTFGSREPNSEKNFAVVDVLGDILGEESVRVADLIKTNDSNVKLWGKEEILSCPGQKVTQSNPGGMGGTKTITPSDPIKFRLSLVMINEIAIGSVSSEVVNGISRRLQSESPFSNTILITLANGRIGYIPEDSSYANPTFEVYGSPLQKGCGADTIVNGLIGMMKQYRAN